MKEENFWELVVLKLSGEATPAQEAELEEALKQHPELGFQLGILEEVWKSRQHKRSPDTADRFNRHLQRLSNHLSGETLRYETTERHTTVYKRAGLLCALVACCALVFFIFRYHDAWKGPMPAMAAQNLVCTKNGSKSKLQLPDGTEVWLNAGSSITYGNDFTGPSRKVTLKGEAFFEVAKHHGVPFIIHTDMMEVKVLGTALNVRAYADEKVAEAALIRGAIEITLPRSPEKKIILRPDEKLIVSNDGPVITGNKKTPERDRAPAPVITLTQVHYRDRKQDKAPMEALWIKNKLVFDDEPLQQVALKLERWYGVEVVIRDEQLKNVEYSGVFEDEELPDVLYALQLTGNFHYTIRKKEVTIIP